MNKQYLDLDEIKAELVKILIETIKFFEENNIQYFISSGTLLGAVRHKGFIPWDDDIDMFVTRPEYDKIIEIAKKNSYITENLQIVSYELGTDMHPFIKIINKNIGIHEKEELDDYLWIDIFPLDGVPNDEKKIIPYLRKCFLMNQLYSVKCQKFRNVLKGSRNFKMKMLKIIAKPFLIFMNKDKFMRKFLKMIRSYEIEKSNNMSDCVWGGYERIYYPKNLINSTQEYDFEGVKVKSFKDSDLYLRTMYGKDYMQLPPVEKRYSHNFKAWYNNTT